MINRIKIKRIKRTLAILKILIYIYDFSIKERNLLIKNIPEYVCTFLKEKGLQDFILIIDNKNNIYISKEKNFPINYCHYPFIDFRTILEQIEKDYF